MTTPETTTDTPTKPPKSSGQQTFRTTQATDDVVRAAKYDLQQMLGPRSRLSYDEVIRTAVTLAMRRPGDFAAELRPDATAE